MDSTITVSDSKSVKTYKLAKKPETTREKAQKAVKRFIEALKAEGRYDERKDAPIMKALETSYFLLEEAQIEIETNGAYLDNGSGSRVHNPAVQDSMTAASRILSLTRDYGATTISKVNIANKSGDDGSKEESPLDKFLSDNI